MTIRRCEISDTLLAEINRLPAALTLGRLVTWAEAGPLPQEGADRLCRRLMAESLLGIATDGAVLTLDEETGRVMIHRLDPLEGLDLEGFVRHLNSFLDVRAKWALLIVGEPTADQSKDIGGHGFMWV